MKNFLCICGGVNYKTYYYQIGQKEFWVLECRLCHLAQTWPKPLNQQTVETFYDSLDDYKLRLAEQAQWKIFSLDVLKIINFYKKDGYLVDVGCNLGIFVVEALKQGYKAYGIDVSEKVINFAGQELKIKNNLSVGNLYDQKYDANKVDILVYQHCLEHIENITKELKEIKRVLSPQGILVIEVPRFFSVWRFFLGKHWYGFCPDQHFWQFGLRGIRNLLQREGFIIIGEKTRMSLDHNYNFSFKGIVKYIINVIAILTGTGDRLILVAKKII